MKSRSELRAGVLLSYLTIFTTVIVGFLLTPYMLERLGQAEYGLYAMMGAFVGTLGLLDFGLNNAIVRYIARYKSEKDKRKEAIFLSTIFNIYLGISFILLIIGIILYFNLNGLLSHSLTNEEFRKARIMFIILIFNLVILLPGNAFSAISTGYEKFIFPRTLILVKYIIRSLTILGILYLGTNAIGIVIVDTIMNILLIFANLYYVTKILKIKISLNSFQKKMLYDIFGYSFWIFIIAITGKFQWQLSQFLVGLKTNTQMVAVMSIGVMLSGFYGAFGSAITGVFLPGATNLVAQNAPPVELTERMIKMGRIVLFIQLYIFGGFIIAGKLFINLWIGSNYYDAWLIAVLIMFAMTIVFVQGYGNSIIEAKKKIKFRAILYLTIISIGLVLGYLMMDKLGILGMGIGISLSMLVNSLLMNVYFYMVIKLDMIKFWKKTYLLPITVFVFIIGLFFLVIDDYFTSYSWSNLFILMILYSIIYILSFYLVVLDKQEKLMFHFKN